MKNLFKKQFTQTSISHPRRFFKAAEVASDKGLFSIKLDSGTAKTLTLQPLRLSSETVARAIQLEFLSQLDHIDTSSMYIVCV